MSGKQMLQLLALLAILVVGVWLAFYVLIVVLVIGSVTAAIVWVRRKLVDHGILAPDATSAPSEDGSTTIEVEYTEVSMPPAETDDTDTKEKSS